MVSIRLDALSTNDNAFEDAGVGVAYDFASPADGRATGPFDRFRRMVHSPRYAPLLGHVEATTGPIERDGDEAVQRVTLTGPDGRTVTHASGLSRSRRGELGGRWLTDSVVDEG